MHDQLQHVLNGCNV